MSARNGRTSPPWSAATRTTCKRRPSRRSTYYINASSAAACIPSCIPTIRYLVGLLIRYSSSDTIHARSFTPASASEYRRGPWRRAAVRAPRRPPASLAPPPRRLFHRDTLKIRRYRLSVSGSRPRPRRTPKPRTRRVPPPPARRASTPRSRPRRNSTPR